MQGLSYRQVSRILEISHTRAEAVQKIAEAIYRPKNPWSEKTEKLHRS
ncbi:Mobile element protein [Thermococcus sp. 2319x1]|nr:Mobile element protein [Thermococcus sp. 2319x1]